MNHQGAHFRIHQGAHFRIWEGIRERMRERMQLMGADAGGDTGVDAIT